MELGHIVPIFVLAAGVLAFTLRQFRKKKVPITTGATNQAGAAPTAPVTTPTPPSQSLVSRLKAGTIGRMSLTVFAFLVLGAMFIMFQTLPRELIAAGSGIVMGILGGMILLSVVMVATGWGNRPTWLVLLVLFGMLAWDTPTSTAAGIRSTTATINDKGLGGAVAIVAEKNPVLAPRLERVIWQAGGVYDVRAGQTLEGHLMGCATFAIPVGYSLQADVIDGNPPVTATPAGHERNPWAKATFCPANGAPAEIRIFAVK